MAALASFADNGNFQADVTLVAGDFNEDFTSIYDSDRGIQYDIVQERACFSVLCHMAPGEVFMGIFVAFCLCVSAMHCCRMLQAIDSNGTPWLAVDSNRWQ